MLAEGFVTPSCCMMPASSEAPQRSLILPSPVELRDLYPARLDLPRRRNTLKRAVLRPRHRIRR